VVEVDRDGVTQQRFGRDEFDAEPLVRQLEPVQGPERFAGREGRQEARIVLGARGFALARGSKGGERKQKRDPGKQAAVHVGSKSVAVVVEGPFVGSP